MAAGVSEQNQVGGEKPVPGSSGIESIWSYSHHCDIAHVETICPFNIKVNMTGDGEECWFPDSDMQIFVYRKNSERTSCERSFTVLINPVWR